MGIRARPEHSWLAVTSLRWPGSGSTQATSWWSAAGLSDGGLLLEVRAASPPWLCGLGLWSLDAGRPPRTPPVRIDPNGIARQRDDGRVVDGRSQGQLGRAEQKRVGAEKGSRQFDHGAWRRHRPRVELADDGLPDVGEDAGEESAQGNPGRVEDIHEAGQPDTEPAPGFGQGGEGDFIAPIGRREQVGKGECAPQRIPTRSAQEGFLADLGLPATAAAAVAEAAVRIHSQMADLACIARCPAQRASTDDEAGADAALAPEADEVVRAAAGSTQMLRRRGQVGVVAYEHREIQIAKSVPDEIAHGHVSPAEIWGVVQVPILGPHRTGYRHADCHDARPVLHPIQKRSDEPVKLVHDLGGIRVGQGAVPSRGGDHRTAKTDDGGAYPVGGEVYRECARSVSPQLDHRRGPARCLQETLGPAPLPDEAARGQFPNEGRNRAAVEPKLSRQLGPGQWTPEVKLSKHPAQIALPDLRLSDATFAT